MYTGIDATGLPPVPSADFPAQWAVINDWDLPQGIYIIVLYIYTVYVNTV